MGRPLDLGPEASKPPAGPAKGPAKGLHLRQKSDQRKQSQVDVCAKLTDALISNVPALDEKERETKLKLARQAISDALLFLKYLHKPTREAVKAKELPLQCADYYLAIAIKESGLNPKAKSYADDPDKGGLGYFQLFLENGKIPALDTVNKRFGLSYEKDNIYPKDDKYQTVKEASKRNAIVGILYWHILRDEIGSTKEVKEKREWKLKLANKDRDKIAAMSYNLGPSAVDRLWAHFKPKDVEEFEKKLAEALVTAYPDYLAQPQNLQKYDDYKDTNYKIGFRVYAYEKVKLPREKGKEKTIKIGDQEYRALKLLEVLRYTELIFSMMHGGPLAGKELPKPAEALPKAPAQAKPAEAPPKPRTTPTPTATPEFVGPPLPPTISPKPAEVPAKGGVDAMGRYEIVGQDHWLWSISIKLLKECQENYKISYCLDESVPKKEKIRFLMEVLIKYNREIDNEDFGHMEDDHDVNSLSRGSKVYFPKKDYIEKSLKQADLEVEAPPLPAAPESLKSTGYYAGPDQRTAAKWNKMGLERFPAAKKPKIVIPKIRVKVPKKKDGKVVKVKGKVRYEYVIRPIDTAKKAPHGKMPKAKVNGVVIHTTEGNHEGLYRNQGIHYVLRTDGTIELVRNLDLAVDHAGIMDNSRSKAMWRGDKQPSLHTVGIEVVNRALSHLVKSGEIFIEAAVKMVKSKQVGKRTIYYTDQVPTEKALKKGSEMALKARALTQKQYASLKQLLHWLGHEFNLKKSDIWTHSMVATSKYGRGRKSDPPILDWAELGLPDNHWQLDQDVLAGQVNPNLYTIENDRTGKNLEMIEVDGKKYYALEKVVINGKPEYSYKPKANFGAEPAISAGLKAAIQIKEKEKEKKHE